MISVSPIVQRESVAHQSRLRPRRAVAFTAASRNRLAEMVQLVGSVVTGTTFKAFQLRRRQRAPAEAYPVAGRTRQLLCALALGRRAL